MIDASEIEIRLDEGCGLGKLAQGTLRRLAMNG